MPHQSAVRGGWGTKHQATNPVSLHDAVFIAIRRPQVACGEVSGIVVLVSLARTKLSARGTGTCQPFTSVLDYMVISIWKGNKKANLAKRLRGNPEELH